MARMMPDLVPARGVEVDDLGPATVPWEATQAGRTPLRDFLAPINSLLCVLGPDLIEQAHVQIDLVRLSGWVHRVSYAEDPDRVQS